MNKKYLFLFIGVIIFFGIFVIFIAIQKNQNQQPPQPSSLHNQNPAALQQTNKNEPPTAPIVTFKPFSGSAQDAARQFYMYYFSTSENPLAAGKYKTNPYLSDDLKNLLASGYNNGNAPLFCPQNKRANITVGKEVQSYWNNQYLTSETISEASPGTKDLYTVVLENNNGHWLVEDVNCIY